MLGFILKRKILPLLKLYFTREGIRVRRQLRDFKKSLSEERASFWEDQFNRQDLLVRFEKAGCAIEEINVDVDAFRKWIDLHPDLNQFYAKLGDVYIEKLLEHYLSANLLDIKKSDVIIDVAAASSPFVNMLRSSGIEAYKQDLVYDQGIEGCKIGGNAANMPVPDEFADVLTLHCSFECFEGNSDKGFAGEISRVLKHGGRIAILPLYIDSIYFVKMSPWCNQEDVDIEFGAKRLWRDDRWRARFSRHYSPEVFVERIMDNISDLDKKIVSIRNIDELSKAFEGQRIYCHFIFKGDKR